MTTDDIRELDDPDLTRVACLLGLAPEGQEAWEPHRRRDQAYDVLCRLRDVGVCTTIEFTPHAVTPVGRVYAWRYPGVRTFFATFGREETEEARAMLLVACLVLAQDGGEGV